VKRHAVQGLAKGQSQLAFQHHVCSPLKQNEHIDLISLLYTHVLLYTATEPKESTIHIASNFFKMAANLKSQCLTKFMALLRVATLNFSTIWLSLIKCLAENCPLALA